MLKRSKQGAIDVVSCGVAITTDNLKELSQTLEACLGDGQPRAVLDMQEVPLLDSAGLETLLDLQDGFEQRAGTLKLAGPNALCRDILNATGVSDYFEIHGEVKSAVGSFLQ
jgi:anti-anti-sigma factor